MKDICQEFILTYTNMDMNCARWTVAQLKDELRRLGLPLGGNKPELCARLTDYYRGQMPPTPSTTRIVDTPVRTVVLPPVAPRPIVISPSPSRRPFPSARSPSVQSGSSIRTMQLPRPSIPSIPLSSRSVPAAPSIPVVPVVMEGPRLNPRYKPEYGACELDEQGNVVDPVSTDIVDPDDVITIQDNGKTFCFSIETLKNIIASERIPKNPFTRTPFSAELIARVRGYTPTVTKTQDYIRAIYNNDRLLATSLLNQMTPEDINRVWNNTTPLIATMNAPLSNRTELLAQLLQKGANPNQSVTTQDPEGNQQIIYPIFSMGYFADPVLALLMLLQYGADVNVKDNNGDTALEMILRQPGRQGDVEVIRTLIQAGAQIPPGIIDRISIENATNLSRILTDLNKPVPEFTDNVMQSFEDLLKNDTLAHIERFISIQEPLDFNDPLPESQLTPIQFVIQKRPNDLDLINYLVNHGATVTQTDIDSTNLPVLKQVLRNASRGNLDRQLYYAVEQNDLPLVRSLIQQGANVASFEDDYYNDPLIEAIYENHDDILEYLLTQAPLTTSQLEDALINIAGTNKDPRFASIILQKGIDPTIVLLHHLEERGVAPYSIVKYLINLGADPGNDSRVLASALDGHDYNYARALLDAGAVISPLVIRTVAHTGNMAEIKLLVDHGLDINADNGIFIKEQALLPDAHIQELLNMGADVGLDEALYNYLLRDGDKSLDVIQALINAGADPLADDYRILSTVLRSSMIPDYVRRFFSNKYTSETSNALAAYFRRMNGPGIRIPQRPVTSRRNIS